MLGPQVGHASPWGDRPRQYIDTGVCQNYTRIFAHSFICPSHQEWKSQAGSLGTEACHGSGMRPVIDPLDLAEALAATSLGTTNMLTAFSSRVARTSPHPLLPQRRQLRWVCHRHSRLHRHRVCHWHLRLHWVCHRHSRLHRHPTPLPASPLVSDWHLRLHWVWCSWHSRLCCHRRRVCHLLVLLCLSKSCLLAGGMVVGGLYLAWYPPLVESLVAVHVVGVVLFHILPFHSSHWHSRLHSHRHRVSRPWARWAAQPCASAPTCAAGFGLGCGSGKGRLGCEPSPERPNMYGQSYG